MDRVQQQVALQIFTVALIFANTIAYLAFRGVAALTNKIAGKEVANRRWVGAFGVVLFSVAAMWYLRTHFVNEKLLASLPAFEQGAYVGEVVGMAIFPAVLVLAIVGFRGWRQSRKQVNGIRV